MAHKDVTSEEKLLKLIRNKKGSKQSADEKSSETKKDALGKGSKNKNKGDILKPVNNILFLILLVVSAYAVMSYLESTKASKRAINAATYKDGQDLKSAGRQKENIKPYLYYQSVLEQRDIFMSPWERPADATASNLSSLEFSKQFRLVGIVVDDNPQAIIEDVAASQTVFVTEGGKVGSAIVEEIKEGKVILLYNNDRIELVP